MEKGSRGLAAGVGDRREFRWGREAGDAARAEPGPPRAHGGSGEGAAPRLQALAFAGD